MTADYETPPLPFTGDPARTCCWCGHEEPNEFLLANNHGPDSGRAVAIQACTAMDLTQSHVQHDVQAVLDARVDVESRRLHGQPTTGADRHLQDAQSALSRSVARARAVWLDPARVTSTVALLGDPTHGQNDPDEPKEASR